MKSARPFRWFTVASFLSLVVLPLGMVTAAEGKPAAKPDATAIKQLIDELGADEFSAREAATEQLARIGLPAYKAVEDAVQHPDREVRYRAERILGRIRQLDLQRRLDSFLRGSEESDDYTLPGWARFKKVYGDDTHSRAVFVDLTKADAELLQAIENSPKAAADVAATRVTQYQQLAQMQQFGGNAGLQLNFGQIATLLFVAGEEDVTLNQQSSQAVFNFCNQQGMADAISNGSRREIPRQMLVRVIVRSEDWAAYQAMSLARRFSMKEGLIPAEKILKGNRQPHMAYYALATIAAMGNDSHIPLVEKLLTDQNVVTQMHEKDKVIYKIEVRDAALATALFLTKQDLKSYFPVREGQTVGDPQQVLTNPRIIGFAEEAKRAETFKKWAEYRAKNPGAAPAKEDGAKNDGKEAPAGDTAAKEAAAKAEADVATAAVAKEAAAKAEAAKKEAAAKKGAAPAVPMNAVPRTR
ncbi:hypothetical protein ETAA8_55960 [Anatilimnocola aggregata]|uniref:HEAT repeat domain-containing protein n=1 Tax=Anatilimnocola aggregata TaxID=2528021 RepID=A0A517YJR4_9BACT|nr:HEAT repeat domain-containing protein [Anatilimnocola aggregata]QDU30456.1 hypothetical protein ETAA8_55960 [Anatilimnocola aggregata]